MSDLALLAYAEWNGLVPGGTVARAAVEDARASMRFAARAFADLDCRHEWGEAMWTAPDLFTPPLVVDFAPPTEHCAIVTRTGFGYQTAAETGAQELERS